MPLSVTCGCGHKFRANEQFAGKEGPCPACGQQVKLQGPAVPPFDVFLSYSSKDKTIADAAVAVLEQRGLRCWVAPRNIVAGKEWGESIIEGLESSALMVLVFSQHSNQSQQVIREVERAVAKGIPIIPFRIEDIPTSKAMEYFISCHHWLDAIDPPLEQHLLKLADMAGHLLGSAPPRTDADAGGLAGKLNAAARTLLGRDRRLQAFVAIAAVVVLAACVALFSAVFGGRDAVASSGLIAAKAQAEVVARQVQALDPGQGLADQIAAVERDHNAAAALFGDKQFAKAETAYAKLAEEGQRVLEIGKERTAAMAKRTAMETALAAAQAAHAEEFAQSDWDNARTHAGKAENLFASGDFASAIEHWNNAAAAYSAAAEAGKKSGLPRLKALALWTSMAAGNKWWFESLRPQPQSASEDPLGGFDPAPGFLPGVRIPGRTIGGGIPAEPVPDDWPPFKATVQQGTVFLDIQARDGLGVDPALIDRLIETQDPGLLDATATKVVDQLKARHGADVEMAYRLGTNVAKLRIMCDLGIVTARPFGGVAALKSPSRGDIIWSTDYVMHRATVTGAPQDLIDTVKEIRRLFDENSDGLYDGDHALTFVYPRMKQRYAAVYDKYFSSVEATTAMFAQAKPPANPPEFPSRSAEDTERMTRLENLGAWFLTDIDRFDRPPVSIVFGFEERGPLHTEPDPEPIMADILQFPMLWRLGLRPLPLQDEHLERLPTLAHLRELWIGSESITPAGMAHVARIPSLEELWLYDTQAPDDEIVPLAACKRLKQFGLSSPNLGDGAAEALSRIPTLEQLHLRETQITDEGVKHLAKLSRLKALDLNQTKVSDACVPHLAKLTGLEQLHLGTTGVGDQSVPELAKLKGLKVLDLSGTKVSKEGFDKLKQALKDCSISGN
jgi:tetratricopeptide (TPR) repeat protein